MEPIPAPPSPPPSPPSTPGGENNNGTNNNNNNNNSNNDFPSGLPAPVEHLLKEISNTRENETSHNLNTAAELFLTFKRDEPEVVRDFLKDKHGMIILTDNGRKVSDHLAGMAHTVNINQFVAWESNCSSRFKDVIQSDISLETVTVFIKDHEVLVRLKTKTSKPITLHYYDYKMLLFVIEKFKNPLLKPAWSNHYNFVNLYKHINKPLQFQIDDKRNLIISFSSKFIKKHNKWSDTHSKEKFVLTRGDCTLLMYDNFKRMVDGKVRERQRLTPVYTLVYLAMAIYFRLRHIVDPDLKAQNIAQEYTSEVESNYPQLYRDVKLIAEFLHNKNIFPRLSDKLRGGFVGCRTTYHLPDVFPRCLALGTNDVINLFVSKNNLYVRCKNKKCWKPLCKGGLFCIPAYVHAERESCGC
jgi:hypothetical protein